MTRIPLRLSAAFFLFLLALTRAPAPLSAMDSAAFEAALSTDPDNVDLRLRYALFLAREGALAAAKREAEAVLARAPEYLDAHLLLGRIAGWQHRFKTALFHVDQVLAQAPDSPEAMALKLDLLRWMQDHTSTEALLSHLISTGQPTADIYYRLAEVELARLQYLMAYRHAVAALRLDPTHRGARNIRDNTRRATLQLSEELEHYGFKDEQARLDRWGMGLTVVATAFQNAWLSATVQETVRYRFRTFNHQIGLRMDYRPKKFIGFTVMGQLGNPARVIPKGTVQLAARGEMFRIMDAALSLVIDILAWPKTDPASLLRPSLTMGFFVYKQLRLGAAYTLGLLRYCGHAPIATHSALASASWMSENVTVNLTVGYSEERDPVTIGIIPPTTCKEITTLEKANAFAGERFRLIEIRSIHAGIDFSLKLNRTATLNSGYRREVKHTDSGAPGFVVQLSHVGVTVWF